VSDAPSFHRGLHRYASVLAGAVVLLIAAGGLVKSLEAGLAVPDWPLSYGSLNPPRWWTIENVRAEHGHRLLAGTVALFTVGLAVWASRREERRWVRRLAWLAVATVLAQAILGGITVLFFLPTAISVSHAALAQAFLCLVTALAVVTSRGWLKPGTEELRSGRDVVARARHAAVLTALIYVQILLGAVMRHIGAGLAIADFPLVFGGLFPPQMSFAIGIHYAHRVGAVVVAVAAFWLLFRLARAPRAGRARDGLARWALGSLILLQIGLGGAVVLTARSPLVNTIHVATGAAVLALSLVLSLTLARRASVAREHAPKSLVQERRTMAREAEVT
jgi:cytochrome c oxidase assembly protein subunit 15